MDNNDRPAANFLADPQFQRSLFDALRDFSAHLAGSAAQQQAPPPEEDDDIDDMPPLEPILPPASSGNSTTAENLGG